MTKPKKPAPPGCDAPACLAQAITEVDALGPCGEFRGHLCPDHLAMFYRVFPIQRAHTALLIAITEEDLRHG